MTATVKLETRWFVLFIQRFVAIFGRTYRCGFSDHEHVIRCNPPPTKEPWDIFTGQTSQANLHATQGKRIADAFAMRNGPVKRRRERDGRIVFDFPRRSDHTIDVLGNGCGLLRGKTRIEHDTSQGHIALQNRQQRQKHVGTQLHSRTSRIFQQQTPRGRFECVWPDRCEVPRRTRGLCVMRAHGPRWLHTVSTKLQYMRRVHQQEVL